MLTRVKLALAGTALLACALPAAAQAQTYYDAGYGYAPAPAYDYSYSYSDPYNWGPTPFWPVNAAAGVVGAAVDAVAAPFTGWRDGTYVDQRIDPDRYAYGYGYGYGYPETYAPAYGDVPVERYAYGQPRYWGGWNGNGYVATYRGKVPTKHHAMHVSAKAKPAKSHKHMAAR